MTRLKIGTSAQHSMWPFLSQVLNLSHHVARPDCALRSALFTQDKYLWQVKLKRGWQKLPALKLQTDGMVPSTSNYGVWDPYSLMLCHGLTLAANQSLLGWDKDSLIGKAKAKQSKEFINHFPRAGHPQDSRAPSRQQWLGKGNTISQCERSPISSSPQSFTC